MVLASLLLAAAAPVNSVEAFRVFESVCVNGRADFAPGAIRPVRTQKIPRDAKKLLWLVAPPERHWGRPKEDQLSAQAFALDTSDDVYLVPPGPGKGSTFASLCVMFIRGNHYESLASKVAALNGDTIEPNQLPSNRSSYNTYFGGFTVTAAREDGWTMLASLANPLSERSEPQK